MPEANIRLALGPNGKHILILEHAAVSGLLMQWIGDFSWSEDNEGITAAASKKDTEALHCGLYICMYVHALKKFAFWAAVFETSLFRGSCILKCTDAGPTGVPLFSTSLPLWVRSLGRLPLRRVS